MLMLLLQRAAKDTLPDCLLRLIMPFLVHDRHRINRDDQSQYLLIQKSYGIHTAFITINIIFNLTEPIVEIHF